MFFEPPEKFTIPPNFGGSCDYIIFWRIVLGLIFFFKTIRPKIIWSQFPPNFGGNWDYIIFQQIVLGSFFFPVVIFSGCNLNPPKKHSQPDDCTFIFR
jgi:hypothetical protein